MSERTKEQVYDEEISPLMTKIIEICKEHRIANVLTFSLKRAAEDGSDDGQDMCCTTCMVTDEFDPPPEYQQMVELIYPPQRCPMMVTVRDGDGDVKSSTAIL